MAIDKNIVPRETPPLDQKGPLLTLDPDQLEDRLKRMSEKDRKKLLDMLDSHQAVMLKRKDKDAK
jgi:hypothetical protein